MHPPAPVTDVITSNSFSTVQEFPDPLILHCSLWLIL